MSERDPLLDWLDRAATRVRLGLVVRDGGWLLCALLALLALHQWLAVAIAAPAVRAALLPFFLFGAISAGAVFLIRCLRRPTRAQAAAAADRHAALHDELRSALWFAGHRDPGVAAQPLLARADRTVQMLDVRRVFPLLVPHALFASITLGLLAAGSPWLLPATRSAAEAGGTPGAAPASIAVGRPPGQPQAETQQPDGSARPQASERLQAAWSQIEALAAGLSGEEEAGGLDRAVAARDAPRAAQILEGLQRRLAAQARPERAARPESEQMSETLAAGILERIKALIQEEDAQRETGATGQPDAPTAHLTEQLRADEEVERGNSRGQQSAGEDALNAMLRAINRSGIGQREVVGGGGEAGQEAGRSNQGGGAMGRRVSNTRAGAGDGERPKGDPKGDAESEPVLGEKTLRLQAQLQRVKVEPTPDEDNRSDEDALYAATRAQAAKTGYEAVTAGPRPSEETAVSSEAIPLAYRDAVKRYTLEQHSKSARP